MTVLTFEPIGGLEVYTRDVAHGLRRLGHDVEVWSVLGSSRRPQPDGVPVRYLSPQSRALRSIHFRNMSRRLASPLRRERERFDLVLAMHPMLAKGVYRALGCGGPPYWVWTYGTDIWGDWDPELERALAAAQKVATISEYTAGRIWSRLPESDVPIVLPMVSKAGLLDELADRSRVSAGTPVLLTVSRLTDADRYKGHDKVIEAIPLIERALGSRIEYHVVGTGNLLPELQAQAHRAGLGERVWFLGWVSDADLLCEYERADLFVMPSRMDPAPGGSTWGEGFGIAYLEAQALGLPVVASSQAGAIEAIRDGVTGIAVDPHSAEQIADACVRLLSSPELARQMGMEGRRLVRSEFGRDAFDRSLERALGESERACAG